MSSHRPKGCDEDITFANLYEEYLELQSEHQTLLEDLERTNILSFVEKLRELRELQETVQQERELSHNRLLQTEVLKGQLEAAQTRIEELENSGWDSK